jgi:predicted NUDIX family NTP pyrophosphohydrolase
MNKDIGTWSVPKGEFAYDESPLAAAKREFFEETGIRVDGNFTELTPVNLKSGKKIFGWALEADIDIPVIISNEFTIEWPPRSGQMKSFPEVDKGEWFAPDDAIKKIIAAQVPFITELLSLIKAR